MFDCRILNSSLIIAKGDHSTFNTQNSTFKAMKKETWKTIIQVIVSILTAMLTAMGTTSCMGHGPIPM